LKICYTAARLNAFGSHACRLLTGEKDGHRSRDGVGAQTRAYTYSSAPQTVTAILTMFIIGNGVEEKKKKPRAGTRSLHAVLCEATAVAVRAQQRCSVLAPTVTVVLFLLEFIE
jgi:hypothetical protein